MCVKHGTYRALRPDRHKIWKWGNAPIPLIEHLRPINFLRSKCVTASGVEGGLIGGKSPLKHIREDMRVNEIIICEAQAMEGESLFASKVKRRYS